LDANNIVFSGFGFENGKSIGVGDIGLSGNRVVNNSFRGDIAYDAIGTHGNNILLAGNTCDVSSSSQGTQGHCYYISHGHDISLLYNVAKGAPGYGIHIFDQQRSTSDFQRVIENVLIEGNLLTASPERSGMIVAMGDEGKLGNRIKGIIIRNNLFVANNFAGIAIGGNVQDVRIEHNTFYANGRQGVTIYNDASINNVQVRNNLFDQSTNTNCQQNCSWYQEAHLERGAGAQNVVLEHNFYAPGVANILGAQDSSAQFGLAGFVNPQLLDFHLQDTSLAIDLGMVLPGVNRDFDGRARPAGKGFDPGAFEHP
jgi:Right handed beta helix region